MGIIAIIARAAPRSCLVVQPEGSVGVMSGHEHGHVALGADAVDYGVAAGGYLKLVGKRGGKLICHIRVAGIAGRLGHDVIAVVAVIIIFSELMR